MCATPAIMTSNATAFFTLKYSDFVQSTVWTNNQLEEFFLFLLLPLFILTMLVSLGFSHYFEEPKNDNKPSKCLDNDLWKKIKKALCLMCLLSIITAAAIFGAVGEKLNRSTLFAINRRNELIAVRIISKGQLAGCEHSSKLIRYTNLVFNSSNFRTTELLENVAYVDALPNQLQEPADFALLNETKTDFYSLLDISLWNTYAPKEFEEKQPHCKKCFYSSLLCDKALESIKGIGRCDGKQNCTLKNKQHFIMLYYQKICGLK